VTSIQIGSLMVTPADAFSDLSLVRCVAGLYDRLLESDLLLLLLHCVSVFSLRQYFHALVVLSARWAGRPKPLMIQVASALAAGSI
jgi:hypothetical protein